MGLIDSAEESETVAASVRDTAGEVLVDLLSFPVMASGATTKQMAFTNAMTCVSGAMREQEVAADNSVLSTYKVPATPEGSCQSASATLMHHLCHLECDSCEANGAESSGTLQDAQAGCIHRLCTTWFDT